MLNPPERGSRVIQVDGTTVSDLPSGPCGRGQAPSEPVVTTLADAAERYPDLVAERLGTLAGDDDPFVARNDAAWRGGAFVYVPRGASLAHPAQIAAIHDSDGAAIGFRTLIVLEEGAEAEVWEQWLTTGHERSGLFNSVTEIFVGPGATLHYVTAQGLGERSWVFASQKAQVERDATIDWVALGFGGAHGKVRMETRLVGPGSHAKVTGAYAGGGKQHLDFDTRQEHAAHDTVSDLAFRGVLDGDATAVWRGMIRVDKGAQQTDAFQESRNLLLSRGRPTPTRSRASRSRRTTFAAPTPRRSPRSTPTSCTTCRAHGLADADAKRLIIEGFLEALVERLDHGPIRAAVSVALERRLGELLGERENPDLSAAA